MFFPFINDNIQVIYDELNYTCVQILYKFRIGIELKQYLSIVMKQVLHNIIIINAIITFFICIFQVGIIIKYTQVEIKYVRICDYYSCNRFSCKQSYLSCNKTNLVEYLYIYNVYINVQIFLLVILSFLSRVQDVFKQ